MQEDRDILVGQDNGFQNRKWRPAAGCPRWRFNRNGQDRPQLCPASLAEVCPRSQLHSWAKEFNLALSMGKARPREGKHSSGVTQPPNQTETPDFVTESSPLSSIN